MRVTIERLGHRGDGIAPGPIFVPRTMPGEVVEGEATDGRIEAPRIIAPSPDRVRPGCPHFNSCGGCALQHASDTFVATWKTQVVKEALRAQGLEAKIAGIETSSARSRIRATFSGRRTKGGALIGFHAPRSEAIARIPGCILLHPDILNAMPALEALVIAGGSRKASLRLAVARSLNGLDVAVTGGKPVDPGLTADLAQIAGESGLARLTWNGELLAQVAPATQRFGRADVCPPPGAFLQATAEGMSAMVTEVRAAVAGARRIADLFSGCGTFSLPLAEFAEVHAVEGEADMIAALDAGWRSAQGVKRVTTETRDLFRRPLMPDELNTFDSLVIDPPRAGASAQFAQIAKSEVPRIAAVSCNPVTFARDARMLIEAGYRLDRLVVIDQFRWSTHIELAAGFSRL